MISKSSSTKSFVLGGILLLTGSLGIAFGGLIAYGMFPHYGSISVLVSSLALIIAAYLVISRAIRLKPGISIWLRLLSFVFGVVCLSIAEIGLILVTTAATAGAEVPKELFLGAAFGFMLFGGAAVWLFLVAF